MNPFSNEKRRFKREIEKDILIKEYYFLRFEYAKRHFQVYDKRYEYIRANEYIFLACCEILKNDKIVGTDIWDCDEYQDYLELDFVVWLTNNISSKIKFADLHNKLNHNITNDSLYLILKEILTSSPSSSEGIPAEAAFAATLAGSCFNETAQRNRAWFSLSNSHSGEFYGDEPTGYSPMSHCLSTG